MDTCDDCGSRVFNGMCTNCDEETYIEDQYRMTGESVPVSIAELAGEQRRKRATRPFSPAQFRIIERLRGDDEP